MRSALRKNEEARDYPEIDTRYYKMLLNKMFSDPCKVIFWDGEEVCYGKGESKFTLILNEPIHNLADPKVLRIILRWED